MKFFKTPIFILAICLSFAINAQNTEASNETTLDKTSYYQKRAAEDAKYEQQFSTENKTEEEAFWEDQEAYEKELKRKDRKAYRAYMKGKRDAYAEHYENCNSHCHHGHHYYSHASFYYYGYNSYYYNRQPNQGTSINTRARVIVPSVRVGFGI